MSHEELRTAVPLDASQYSPFVLRRPGWGSTLMYYCKNTPIGGIYRDRVWRVEQFNGEGWSNDQVVIEGQSTESDDDLSCSPGVVIDASGTWHMYYIAANRDRPMELFLYHASAAAPGVGWTKHGPIQGWSQPTSFYFETPTPRLLADGSIELTVAGDKVYRSVSADGHSFSAPQTVPGPVSVQAGRVTETVGMGSLLVYAKGALPNEIWLSNSTDGGSSYPPGSLLATSDGSGWDGHAMWSPQLRITGSDEITVYYAGTPRASSGWWGSGGSLGMRRYRLLEASPIV